MANLIQVRRGVRAMLPTLSPGEIGFCTDTKEIFVGSAQGNIAFLNAEHTHDFTHDHDDRYYTQVVLDSMLEAYSKTTHTHTEYALSAHNHDGAYYKKAEVDSLVNNKANPTTVGTTKPTDGSMWFELI